MSMIKKNFPVLDMSCASCAMSIQSMLLHTEGVKDASVNFGTATAVVEYDSTLLDEEKIQTVVRSIGFDILLEDDSTEDETLELLQQKKLKKLRRTTILAILFSLPVFIVGMFFMDMPYANWIMFIFTTPVVFWMGRQFYINAWKQLKHGIMNMDTLVALSTGAAYLFSVFNMFYPEYWHSKGLHAHVYFEAASVIIAFILLGRLMEERAKGNTADAVKKLIGLQPKTVHILQEDGSTRTVPLSEVEKGDIIIVKPGQKIPVDGTVVAGESYVNESMLSGEPLPLLKAEGQPVYAGTINQNGSLNFKAEKIGKETMLGQIIRMVKDAQGSKAPVQKLVDKIAGIFVPIVIAIAVITFLAWMILGQEHSFSNALMAAITVLIIACPCALGLATPTAIIVGVGKAAGHGILVKDAESIESAQKVTAMILDKTGTITEGSPSVTDIIWTGHDDAAARILKSIEMLSEHPLAQAVVRSLEDKDPVVITSFESITGRGVKAVFGNKTYLAGNQELLEEYGLSLPEDLLRNAVTWLEEAKTVIWFSDEKNVLAVLSVTDAIKDTSAAAIQNLMNMGIEVYMLTGDNLSTARAIAEKTGIRHVRAHMMPQDKADFVKQLQDQGKIVAMAGDGINDSAALAQADVSIAMGKGSDIAIEVAKMTIISSDLSRLPQAIRISRQTVSTIKQNLFWAFFYNVTGIPIAAGVLYPVNGFMLNPMIAGAAMALSSVFVVSNSLRLKLSKID